MAKKKFSKEIEALVKYVRDNMKDENGWVVIRYRDVPKITGIRGEKPTPLGVG